MNKADSGVLDPAVPCLACTCNDSIPAAAFNATGTPAHALCRGDLARFRDAARLGGPLVVGCTQEAAFFTELAERASATAELRFVNLREAAGSSSEGAAAGPKIAALLAMAQMPAPSAVPSIDLDAGRGRLAIVGPTEAALDWAQRLGGQFEVTVLATDGGGLPAQRDFPVHAGREMRVEGHLGAFELHWRTGSPIDLDRCTGCAACVRACPEHAISRIGGIGPRHDGARCTPHGACRDACVAACGTLAAIDFSRLEAANAETFDLVFDLSRQPLLRRPHLRDGYLAPGADVLAQSEAARGLAGLVGAFERPRFLAHAEARCAHHRQGTTGCTRCIDVCSTEAIRGDGQRIHVDAALCAGCGGCATVCPTGSARHVFPAPGELMARLERGLAAYARAGGRDAVVLVHAASRRDAVHAPGREGRGLPARVLPFEVHDVAAFGLDYALAAICYGAAQLRVVVHAGQAESYLAALREQYAVGNLILAALGLGEGRLGLLEEDSLAAGPWEIPEMAPLPARASFAFATEKRAALDLALGHLRAIAAGSDPALASAPIALPAGAPFGAVEVDAKACTLCMSCAGACPVGALLDTPGEPTLRFVEHNCVQCGLCAKTCPEDAIRLVPRLWLHDDARRPRVANRSQPFHCESCGKEFGTRQMIDAMLARLSGHGMFAGEAQLRRLRMCADCRVVDMLQARDVDSMLETKQ